ncbi:MAG: hypothetical protein ACSHW1_17080 [Yoonia sp.]|uniref:hypothetical protein n=1 Tax=Yoonia sp. TaxID=2212373 RepID=UPI003EF55600
MDLLTPPLTALPFMATCDESSKARLALRLSLVITVRFICRLGLFNVSQKELARMWGVAERTSRPEIAVMRSLGGISIGNPAARGHVAQY